MASNSIRIGTAGWSLPKAHRSGFGAGASNLARYATRLNAVEINSSFYRPHRAATYARWADTVPEDFRFAVKIPKAITHAQRLADADALLAQFLSEAGALGDKLGPLLVQLPPSLKFDAKIAGAFFGGLRAQFGGAVVCEPRHASWFTKSADALLRKKRVAVAAADPARVPEAAQPRGDSGIAYFRWHGSPRMYYSNYEPKQLAGLAVQVRKARKSGAEVWCMFDNTTLGAATANALEMLQLTAR